MGWRPRHPDEREVRLSRLQAAFRAVTRPLERRARWRRGMRVVSDVGAPLLLTVGMALAILCVWSLTLPPWPIEMKLRHFAAFPNCAAARSVGLAPALRGEPGYHPFHDADGDGIACEPRPK